MAASSSRQATEFWYRILGTGLGSLGFKGNDMSSIDDAVQLTAAMASLSRRSAVQSLSPSSFVSANTRVEAEASSSLLMLSEGARASSTGRMVKPTRYPEYRG